ncbi:hypothetical protein D3C71_1577510 [compost metagenome]
MKVFSGTFEPPESAPMKLPESKVSTPETPPAPMRGRTTQKRAPRVANDRASLDNCTLATTLFLSSARSTVVTSPITTLRYLTWVLCATRPSPVWKEIEISGPCCIQLRTTNEAPTRTARMGTIQTSDTFQRRVRTCACPGAARLSVSCTISAVSVVGMAIPDQPWIEAHR